MEGTFANIIEKKRNFILNSLEIHSSTFIDKKETNRIAKDS